MNTTLAFLFNRPDGVIVPYGKGTDTGVVNPRGYTLNYNGNLSFCSIVVNVGNHASTRKVNLYSIIWDIDWGDPHILLYYYMFWFKVNG